MNGVPFDYEGSLTMKADGTWYVNRISCGDAKIEGWGAKMHLMMVEAEQLLYRHNTAEQQVKEEKE